MSDLLLNEGAAPGTPAAGKLSIYVDSADGKVKAKDDAGLIYSLMGDGTKDQNLIVNGGFAFSQRTNPGSAATVSQTAARGFAADRWAVTNENASAQYQRIDTAGTPESGLGARFYGKVSKITSTGKIVWSQSIESSVCSHLRSGRVRVQMKLKASAAKTMRIALLQLQAAGTVDTIPGVASGIPSGTFVSAFGANGTDPTFGTNLAKITPANPDNATVVSTGLSCSVTTAWQRFSGTFDLPSDFKNLVLVVITDSQFAAADFFCISEVGIYDGAEIRDWAPPSPAEELLRCQRYYCKTFRVDTAPAQNAGTGTGELRLPSPVGASAAFSGWCWELPNTLRASGSGVLVTTFNPGAANAEVRNETLGSDCTTTATAGNSDKRVPISATTPASTAAGNLLGLHASCEAEL